MTFSVRYSLLIFETQYDLVRLILFRTMNEASYDIDIDYDFARSKVAPVRF